MLRGGELGQKGGNAFIAMKPWIAEYREANAGLVARRA
jgi:hypothetical protein